VLPAERSGTAQTTPQLEAPKVIAQPALPEQYSAGTAPAQPKPKPIEKSTIPKPPPVQHRPIKPPALTHDQPIRKVVKVTADCYSRIMEKARLKRVRADLLLTTLIKKRLPKVHLVQRQVLLDQGNTWANDLANFEMNVRIDLDLQKPQSRQPRPCSLSYREDSHLYNRFASCLAQGLNRIRVIENIIQSEVQPAKVEQQPRRSILSEAQDSQ
jgi:hypothetical protein